MSNTMEQNIQAIKSHTKQLPFFKLVEDKNKEEDKVYESYESFYEEYDTKIKEVLKNLLLDPDIFLAFNINKDNSNQNGILLSSFLDDKDKREKSSFYEGAIWSDKEKREEFYNIFKLSKRYFGVKSSSNKEADITIIDFLLYEDKLLIPPILKIKSVNEEDYTSDNSTYGCLKLPNLNVENTIWNDLKSMYGRYKSNDEYKDFLKYAEEGERAVYETIKSQYDEIRSRIENKLDIIKYNMNSAGLDIEHVDDNNKIISAVVMHSFSIYARDIIIFSSGTYNNVSGLVFACSYDSENWNKIIKYKEELLYLDGTIRRITRAEILHDKDAIRRDFRDRGYDKRVEKYKILSDIVKAILMSAKNTPTERSDKSEPEYYSVDSISTRVKDYNSLFDKLTKKENIEKYRKIYEQRKWNELFFEDDSKIHYIPEGESETYTKKERMFQLKADLNDPKERRRELDKKLQEKILYYDEENNTGDVYFSTIKNKKNIITDFCGARILFTYLHEAREFGRAENLSKYFNIHELEDKFLIDRTQDEYKSCHYILSLKDKTINIFDEKKRIGLANIVFELQIRTNIQHGWASASHDIIYKHQTNNLRHDDIANLKRSSHKLHEVDEQISKIKKG